MKLFIECNNTEYNAELNNTEPILEQISPQILLFENYVYKFIVREENEIEDIEMFIGDNEVPLHYNEENYCYETNQDKLLSGCFDLISISIVFILNGNEEVLYSDYIRVAATKQTVRQVEVMLNEIENSIPNSLNVCFSKNRNRSGIQPGVLTRSIWNTLSILDQVISVYDKNFSFFINHKKSSIENTPMIVDVKSMREIDLASLQWIVCNPDNMVLTKANTGISLDGKNYIPTKIKTYSSKYSFDLYENRVILGFLATLISYIETQVNTFNQELEEIDNIPQNILRKLPNSHELTGRCIYIYYKGVVDKLNEKKEQLVNLLTKYERVMLCGRDIVNAIPRMTNTFKAIYQYRACYDCMVKWFRYGDYDFNHIDYLFRLKKLTRIFEYFCLIKIHSAISLAGYSLQETDRLLFQEEVDERELTINNYFRFVGNGRELTLMYEPTIWTNRLTDSMNLYSTGYNFIKALFNDFWTPDFVLKIRTDKGEYYYIFDSKYSSLGTVRKKLFKELVLKYSSQIASMNKHWSDIIGVGALYPSDKQNVFFFKKNDVGSCCNSLPYFFAMSVVGGEEGTYYIKEKLEEFISTTEVIESKQRNAIRAQNIKSDMNQSFLETEVDRQSTDTSMVEIPNRRGMCRKCLYYGRSKCLFKGKITNPNNHCDDFTQKSLENVTEASTCRNLIVQINHRRENLVCKITGNSFCVGSESCKYYLRKRQH